jgi:uncharacterized protein (TIGR02118 family)
MIKVSVFYPHEQGKSFDMDYYLNKHIPMVQEMMGEALKGGAVEEGLSGADPASPPLYFAMGHLYFETVESFQSAFGPHAEAILGDVPNYTGVQPMVQISEVKL